MAITARFAADFSSFTTAVEKAQVQLRSFETNAGKVEKALSRMTDNFSGRKVIQDATLMAKAIELTGGAANLTTSELQKANAVIGEASAKMKALGLEVPKSFQSITTAAKGSTGIVSELGKSIATTAAGFITGTAIIAAASKAFHALTGAISSSIASASHLDDLSKSTNISVGKLQELGFAGKRVGLTLDDIATSTAQLSKRLATGDGSAVGAVASLGLNLAALKSQKPDEQFVQIAEAVSRITDPLAQAGIGSELFGRQFQNVLRLSNDGLRETMAQAKAAGAVLGDDAVKSLDKFGDKVGDITQRVKVLTASALTPLIDTLLKMMAIGDDVKLPKFIDPKQQELFEKFQKQLKETATTAETATPKFQGLAGGLTVTGDAAAALGRASFELAKPMQITGEAAKALAAGQGSLITSSALLENTLKSLREGGLEPLSATQRKQITELDKWSKSEKEIATLVGVSEQAVHKFLTTSKASVGQHEKLTKELERGTDAAHAMERGWAGLTSQGLAVNRMASDQVQDLNKVRQELRLLERSSIEAALGQRGIILNFAALGPVIKPATSDLAEFNQNLKELEFVGPILETLPRGFGALKDSLEKVLAGIPDLLTQAFTGGGGAIGAAKALGTQLGAAVASSMGKKTAETVGANGAKIAGSLAAVSIATAAWTAGLSLAAIGIVKLLSPSQAEKAAKLRKEFLLLNGGVEELDARAKKAGLTLDRFLNAKTVKSYTAEVEKLRKAFEFQDAAVTELEAVFKKYNIGLGSAGVAGNTHIAAMEAAAFWRELKLLEGAGLSLADILGTEMGPALTKFIQSAARAGVSLPNQFKGLAQQMIDLGLIVDDNGKAFGSLEEAGLTFGGNVQAQFEDLIAVVNDLAQAIRLAFGFSLTPEEQAIRDLKGQIDDTTAAMMDFLKRGPGPLGLYADAAEQLRQKLKELQDQYDALIRNMNSRGVASGGSSGTSGTSSGGTTGASSSGAGFSASRVLSFPSGAAVSPASGPIVTETQINLDGAQIARTVSRRQIDQRRNRYKSGAA